MYTKRFRTLFRLSIPVCLLLTVLPALTARSAPAVPAAAAPAAIAVTTDDDEFGSGIHCSLREAIQSANTGADFDGCTGAKAGANIITLPAGAYTLYGAAGEDGNASGDLDITGTLTIRGAGEKTTSIQAGTNTTNGVDRVLHIHSGAIVEINDVTIRYGKTADGVDGASDDACKGVDGGGIYTEGTLILNDCTVAYNHTGDGGDGCTVTSPLYRIGGNGGGIYSYEGTLILNHTAVSNNETGAGGDGGAGSDGTPGGSGGGIFLFPSGVMTLTDSVVSNNTTGDGGRGGDATGGDASYGGFGGFGGGIYAYASTTLIDSTITGNTTGAGGDGGDVTSGDGDGGAGGVGGWGAGIYVAGSATSLAVIGSTSSDNETGLGGSRGKGSGTGSSGADGYSGWGGGLYADDNSHTTLHDSTLRNNTALIGGGILNGYGAITTLTNCTLSGNRAEYGGGIYIGGGATTLTHITITDNTADWDQDGSGEGGGVYADGTLTMTNTLVAENIDTGGEAPDCYGMIASGDYNLLGIGDSVGCTFTSQANDLVGTTAAPIDPLLGVLGNNGGPTWTHPLNPGSPAIDQIPAGVNGCVVGSRDQRGELRAPPCDIGAYELNLEFVYLPLVVKD